MNRQFQASRPNALWLSDFTYVATGSGFVLFGPALEPVAGSALTFRHRRLRPQACRLGGSSSLQAGFVLDALDQALYDRRPLHGHGLIHHSDRGVQGGFRRSSQHQSCSPTAATPQALPLAVSSPASFLAWR